MKKLMFGLLALTILMPSFSQFSMADLSSMGINSSLIEELIENYRDQVDADVLERYSSSSLTIQDYEYLMNLSRSIQLSSEEYESVISAAMASSNMTEEGLAELAQEYGEEAQALINGQPQTINPVLARERVAQALASNTAQRIRTQAADIRIENDSVIIESARNASGRIMISATALAIDGEEMLDAASSARARIASIISNQGNNVNISVIRDEAGLIMSQNENGINVRIRNQEIIISNNSIRLNISNNEVELEVMPEQAMINARVNNQTRANIELIVENEIPKYQIREQVAARLLGLIPVQVDIDSRINALTGELENQARPWWSFLAI